MKLNTDGSFRRTLKWGRRSARRILDYLELPAIARSEYIKDRKGLLPEDPGIIEVIKTAIAWIGMAQDHSISNDGGVASYFSLKSGWADSYPETTGYIIPTMLEHAYRTNSIESKTRARKMLDWLVSIQFTNGAFQGGTINVKNPVPVTFNTGQILFGLVAGTREFGDEYEPPLRAAADWLIQTQDEDGCWRSFPSPLTKPGDKTYDTHVAWALIEAERLIPNHGYGEAGLANVDWAISKQNENGWFQLCCLDEPTEPLTHTIGYVLRGCLEAYKFSQDSSLLEACRRTADGLLDVVNHSGYLHGRLNSKWQGTVPWECLTGSVQIAHCWLLLYKFTGDLRYLVAAKNVNLHARRTVRIDGPPEIRGAVKGSFPINGGYCPYRYLNWACKFFIDSHFMEQDIINGV